MLEFPALTSGPCFNATHRRFSRRQVRLCGIDSPFLGGNYDFIGLPVEFGEEIVFVHAVIVIHENS